MDNVNSPIESTHDVNESGLNSFDSSNSSPSQKSTLLKDTEPSAHNNIKRSSPLSHSEERPSKKMKTISGEISQPTLV